MRPKAWLILLIAALAACDKQPSSTLDRPVVADAATGSVSDARAVVSGIRGRVQSENGTPVAGAVIRAECAAEPCKPIPEIGVLSDAAGMFFWPLQHGIYRLTAQKDHVTSCSQTVAVTPSQDEQLTLTLSASGDCPL
jgi:hypothetical protein